MPPESRGRAAGASPMYADLYVHIQAQSGIEGGEQSWGADTRPRGLLCSGGSWNGAVSGQNRQIGPWGRVESPEVEPHKQSKRPLAKKRQYSGAEMAFLTNACRKD